jgi:hypothetical protein
MPIFKKILQPDIEVSCGPVWPCLGDSLALTGAAAIRMPFRQRLARHRSPGCGSILIACLVGAPASGSARSSESGRGRRCKIRGAPIRYLDYGRRGRGFAEISQFAVVWVSTSQSRAACCRRLEFAEPLREAVELHKRANESDCPVPFGCGDRANLALHRR